MVLKNKNTSHKGLSELDKMLSGKPYDAADKELRRIFFRCKSLIEKFNQTTHKQSKLREKLLKQLLGKTGKDIYIEPRFYCDYGINISLGDNVYLNTDCVFLDCAKINIGSNVLFAPGVHIYTAHHSVKPEERVVNGKIIDLATPVTIGSNVWIGGKVIILPGVTIGDNTTIGAGSVVTKSIPSGVIAIGNPCRVIKKI